MDVEEKHLSEEASDLFAELVVANARGRSIGDVFSKLVQYVVKIETKNLELLNELRK